MFVLIAGTCLLVWNKLPELYARRSILDLSKYARDINDIKISKSTRILSLGEASHGNKEFQELKLSLLKKVVAEDDVRSFCLEADFGEGLYIDDYIKGKRESIDLNKVFSFNIYHSKEMKDLVEWMRFYNESKKDKDKLSFYGFDIQNPEKTAAYILDFCKMNNIEIAQTSKDILDDMAKAKSKVRGKSGEEIRNNLSKLKPVFKDYPLIKRSIENIVVGLDYYSMDMKDYIRVNNFRDKSMAENIGFISSYENNRGYDRIMISGHNWHVRKSSLGKKDYKPMGQYLTEAFHDGYFVVGTDYYKTLCNINEVGKGVARGNHSFCSADILAEKARYFKGKYYLDFASLGDGQSKKVINSKIKMGSLGEGYSFLMKIVPKTHRVEEVPSKLYDGMYFIYEASPIETE